MIRNVS